MIRRLSAIATAAVTRVSLGVHDFAGKCRSDLAPAIRDWSRLGGTLRGSSLAPLCQSLFLLILDLLDAFEHAQRVEGVLDGLDALGREGR